MRKAIERFVFITACCSLLAMLPLHSAQAQDSAPAVDVAIPSHFIPDVAAPPSGIGIAPIDPGRPIFGACAGHGGGVCIQAGLPPIPEQPPGGDCGPPCQLE